MMRVVTTGFRPYTGGQWQVDWTLWQVSTRFDGRGLFAQSDGGTLWEFVKIHEVW